MSRVWEQIRFTKYVIASACCRDAGHDAGLLRGCKLKIGKKPRLFSPNVLFWPQEAPRGAIPFLGSTRKRVDLHFATTRLPSRLPAHFCISVYMAYTLYAVRTLGPLTDFQNQNLQIFYTTSSGINLHFTATFTHCFMQTLSWSRLT